VGARARAPTQDPLEVVEGRERASERGCVQSDEHRQEMQADSLVFVWDLE